MRECLYDNIKCFQRYINQHAITLMFSMLSHQHQITLMLSNQHLITFDNIKCDEMSSNQHLITSNVIEPAFAHLTNAGSITFDHILVFGRSVE